MVKVIYINKCIEEGLYVKAYHTHVEFSKPITTLSHYQLQQIQQLMTDIAEEWKNK